MKVRSFAFQLFDGNGCVPISTGVDQWDVIHLCRTTSLTPISLATSRSADSPQWVRWVVMSAGWKSLAKEPSPRY